MDDYGIVISAAKRDKASLHILYGDDLVVSYHDDPVKNGLEMFLFYSLAAWDRKATLRWVAAILNRREV